MLCSTCENKECIAFLMNFNSNTLSSLKNVVDVQQQQLDVLESRLYWIENKNGINYDDYTKKENHIKDKQ